MAGWRRVAETNSSARLFQLFIEVNERGVPVPRCRKPAGTPVTAGGTAPAGFPAVTRSDRDEVGAVEQQTARPISAPIPDRPLVERRPSDAPDGRSTPPEVDHATEVAALADLLAEVVHLARDCAVFPSRWAQVAELALEHGSVRAALRADPPPLSTQHIITQLNQLRDLIGDGHARS